MVSRSCILSIIGLKVKNGPFSIVWFDGLAALTSTFNAEGPDMDTIEKQRRERSRLKLAALDVIGCIPSLEAQGFLVDLSLSGCAIEFGPDEEAGLNALLTSGWPVHFELDINGEGALPSVFEGQLRSLRPVESGAIVAGLEFLDSQEMSSSAVVRFLLRVEDIEAPHIEFIPSDLGAE